MDRRQKDKAIAGGVTLVAATVILLFLLFVGMGNVDKRLLSQVSIPEPEDIPLFLEPELDLSSPGENNELPEEADAPLPPGEPEKADSPEPETTPVVPGNSEKPLPVTEPVTTQKRPSPVKASENPVNTAEEKRLKSMESKFSKTTNGVPEGKTSTVVGKGKVNTNGSLYGRKFIGCPTYPLEISGKVVVKVNVKVNARGNVTYAKAVSGSSKYYSVCEGWARQARWTEQADAPLASGSITFTISPK